MRVLIEMKLIVTKFISIADKIYCFYYDGAWLKDLDEKMWYISIYLQYKCTPSNLLHLRSTMMYISPVVTKQAYLPTLLTKL
jgi:hypothetical protein